MLNNQTELTKEDFSDADLQILLDKSKNKVCNEYSTILFMKCEDEIDEKAKEFYGLMGMITSFYLDLEKPDNPFGPMYLSSQEHYRTADVCDINDSYLRFLSEIYLDMTDDEIKSRIADVLWVKKKDYNAGINAIQSYLNSSIILEKNWLLCFNRIKRALQISAYLGRKNGEFEKVIKHIEYLLKKINGEDHSFFSYKLMLLLLKQKAGEPNCFVELAEKCAIRAEAENFFNVAKSYWEIQSKWYSILKDEEKKRLALINSAECLVKEAEKAIKDNKPYLGVCGYMGRAIMLYIKIPNTKDRKEELQGLLIGYQKKIALEMKTISSNIDILKYIEESKQKVKGLQIYDALFTLAIMNSPSKPENLKITAEILMKENPFSHLCESIIINDNGRTIGKIPSIMTDEDSQKELAIKSKMYECARFEQNINTQAIIIPAIEQILLEHHITKEDFYPLVFNNPCIPEGREMIFIEGLHAGIHKDFLISTHLLIPQLENSVREIIYNSGGVASGFDKLGIQDEQNLNKLLFREDVIQYFGENIAFDLQGLLVERSGSNLRNISAHGLCDHDSFYSFDNIYLWWLVLRICFIPILNNLHNEDGSF